MTHGALLHDQRPLETRDIVIVVLAHPIRIQAGVNPRVMMIMKVHEVEEGEMIDQVDQEVEAEVRVGNIDGGVEVGLGIDQEGKIEKGRDPDRGQDQRLIPHTPRLHHQGRDQETEREREDEGEKRKGRRKISETRETNEIRKTNTLKKIEKIRKRINEQVHHHRCRLLIILMSLV